MDGKAIYNNSLILFCLFKMQGAQVGGLSNLRAQRKTHQLKAGG